MAAASEPMAAPISAEAVMNPCSLAVSWNKSFNWSWQPEMTAVSNPNNSPPNAPTSVAPSKAAVIFAGGNSSSG